MLKRCVFTILLICMAGCVLPDGDYKIVSAEGKPPKQDTFVNFYTGRVFYRYCNNYMSTIQQTGETLKFGRFITTLMFCAANPGELTEQELVEAFGASVFSSGNKKTYTLLDKDRKPRVVLEQKK